MGELWGAILMGAFLVIGFLLGMIVGWNYNTYESDKTFKQFNDKYEKKFKNKL